MKTGFRQKRKNLPKSSKTTNKPAHLVIHHDQLAQEKEVASAEQAMSKAARQL